MADIDTIPSTPVTDRSEAAYLACLAEISTLPEAELLPVTLDTVSVTTSLFGILPELRALRGQIAATWREFDFERFDRLEQYALALAHAHGIYNRLSTPKGNVSELAAELIRVRDQLYAVAVPLVGYGLVGSAELDKCKVALGYRPLISDVITLVGVFKDHWATLEGKVPVTQAELLRAKNRALDLMQALGLKEQSPVSVGDAALIRQKAFTLFIRTYEEARRAVLYLRADNGDADEIAPSFYALRAGKRRPIEEAPEAAAGSGTPKPPSVAAAATPSPAAAPFVLNNQAGLPLDNPFTH